MKEYIQTGLAAPLFATGYVTGFIIKGLLWIISAVVVGYKKGVGR